MVEFVLLMFLFVGTIGGGLAYLMAEHARSVVIQAAYAAARTASIECGAGNPNAWTDSVLAAETALQDGRLQLVTNQDPSTTNQPGAWWVSGGCQNGVAAVTVSYNQLNLFPVLGPMLVAGVASGWSFYLTSGMQLPVEGA